MCLVCGKCLSMYTNRLSLYCIQYNKTGVVFTVEPLSLYTTCCSLYTNTTWQQRIKKNCNRSTKQFYMFYRLHKYDARIRTSTRLLYCIWICYMFYRNRSKKMLCTLAVLIMQTCQHRRNSLRSESITLMFNISMPVFSYQTNNRLGLLHTHALLPT